MGKSKRVARREARAAAKKRRRILQFGVISIVVLLAGAAWAASRPPQSAPLSDDRKAVEHSLGPSDAPVTIVEFGDYNCPSCTRYHELGIIQQILVEYPEQVRFVFRHFPVITADSPQLAEAAECAFDQGQFWEFHEVLYTFSPSRSSAVHAYADQLEIDQDTFKVCVENRHYAELVQSQMQEAFRIGFRGTPSFMINETPLAGPPSYDQLKSMIDMILTN